MIQVIKSCLYGFTVMVTGVTKIDPVLEPGTITLAMHAHGLDLDKDDKYFEDLR